MRVTTLKLRLHISLSVSLVPRLGAFYVLLRRMRRFGIAGFSSIKNRCVRNDYVFSFMLSSGGRIFFRFPLKALEALLQPVLPEA